MAFKKLDSAAVASTNSSALDAFVLQGEDNNYIQAHEDRGRGVGHAYASDARPVLASPQEWPSCVPFGVFPLSDRCTELTVQVRGLATVASGKTDACDLKLMAQRFDGTFLEAGSSTTVTGSASVQTVTLTLDVTSMQGRAVVVWLFFVSVESAALASGTQAGSDITVDGTQIRLNNVSFTFDSDKRYALTFAEDPAGADTREAFSYTGAVMIQSNPATHEFYIIPALPLFMESYTAFEVSLLELGRLEVYGWSLTETDFEELPALTPKLRPGGRLRARTCQEMYRRGYHLHTKRTRLAMCGGSRARLMGSSPSAVNRDRWSGRAITAGLTSTDDVYIVCIGQAPSYRVQVDSSAPTTQ